MTPAKPTPQESGSHADSASPTPGIAGVGEALGALRGPRHERGGLVVVRQLVGTTLGVLRHLVWTTFAPAERDHLVGGLPGSVS